MYPPEPPQRQYKEGDVLVSAERTIIIMKIKTNQIRFTEIFPLQDIDHDNHNFTKHYFNEHCSGMLLFRHGKLR